MRRRRPPIAIVNQCCAHISTPSVSISGSRLPRSRPAAALQLRPASLWSTPCCHVTARVPSKPILDFKRSYVSSSSSSTEHFRGEDPRKIIYILGRGTMFLQFAAALNSGSKPPPTVAISEFWQDIREFQKSNNCITIEKGDNSKVVRRGLKMKYYLVEGDELEHIPAQYRNFQQTERIYHLILACSSQDSTRYLQQLYDGGFIGRWTTVAIPHVSSGIIEEVLAVFPPDSCPTFFRLRYGSIGNLKDPLNPGSGLISDRPYRPWEVVWDEIQIRQRKRWEEVWLQQTWYPRGFTLIEPNSPDIRIWPPNLIASDDRSQETIRQRSRDVEYLVNALLNCEQTQGRVFTYEQGILREMRALVINSIIHTTTALTELPADAVAREHSELIETLITEAHLITRPILPGIERADIVSWIQYTIKRGVKEACAHPTPERDQYYISQLLLRVLAGERGDLDINLGWLLKLAERNGINSKELKFQQIFNELSAKIEARAAELEELKLEVLEKALAKEEENQAQRQKRLEMNEILTSEDRQQMRALARLREKVRKAKNMPETDASPAIPSLGVIRKVNAELQNSTDAPPAVASTPSFTIHKFVSQKGGQNVSLHEETENDTSEEIISGYLEAITQEDVQEEAPLLLNADGPKKKSKKGEKGKRGVKVDLMIMPEIGTKGKVDAVKDAVGGVVETEKGYEGRGVVRKAAP